jgi:hypothetical protein
MYVTFFLDYPMGVWYQLRSPCSKDPQGREERGNLQINTNPRNGRTAFNTALFSLPALGQLGSASRRFFYGPGINNFDLALLKDVRLTESKSLQVRLEAFNALNHAQFFGPASVNGNISSPLFGRVVSAAPPRILQLGAKFTF